MSLGEKILMLVFALNDFSTLLIQVIEWRGSKQCCFGMMFPMHIGQVHAFSPWFRSSCLIFILQARFRVSYEKLWSHDKSHSFTTRFLSKQPHTRMSQDHLQKQFLSMFPRSTQLCFTSEKKV